MVKALSLKNGKKDWLWAVPGVGIGLGLLLAQQLGVHRLLVLAGGLMALAIMLISQHRLRWLSALFFVTLVYNPDKYLSLVYGCSWSDGINLSAADVVFGLVVLTYLLEGHSLRRISGSWDKHLDVPMGLLLLAAFLSLKNSVHMQASLFMVYGFAKLYLIYWFFRRFFERYSPATLLVGGLSILILFEFLIFGLELMQRGGSLAGFRFAGTYSNPNALAELIAPISVLLMAYYVGAPAGRLKWLSMLAFCLSLILLLATFSRGGWISATVSLGVLVLILVRRGRLQMRYLLWLGMIFLLLLAVFHQPILERLHFNDASARSRFYLNSIAWQMIQSYPVFGIGVNTFPFVMKEFYHPGLQVSEWLHTVHNQYLLVWSEMGLPGIAAFLWLLWGSIGRGFRASRKDYSLNGYLALGIALALFTSSLHMLVDMYVAQSNLIVMWLYFAALGSLLNRGAEEGVRDV